MVPDGHAAAVIVLAAGEGSRMRSAIPKVLHPVAGRPLVEHAVRAAAGLDPRHLAVVVGHGREDDHRSGVPVWDHPAPLLGLEVSS